MANLDAPLETYSAVKYHLNELLDIDNSGDTATDIFTADSKYYEIEELQAAQVAMRRQYCALLVTNPQFARYILAPR